ncbi:MAG: hypothetical protein AAGG01_14375 [Planctomycetota bacterium]
MFASALAVLLLLGGAYASVDPLPSWRELLGSVGAPSSPAVAQASPPLPSFSTDTFTLPLRVPEAQLERLLSAELAERRLLKDFQVVTSKFSRGRVLLDDLQVRQGPRPGTARLEAHGRLRFDRRQLGVKWRGLKSHKKWYQKGAKDVARARVTCVVELGQSQAHPSAVSIAITLSKVRVKLVSRLNPARGLTARFDVPDRRMEWTPGPRAIAGRRLAAARIVAVERDAIRLEVDFQRVP